MHTMQEWHNSAYVNMSQAISAHRQAHDQMGVAYRAHDDTVSENLMRYNELHISLETKVKTSKRLIDKLRERSSSVENTIETAKQLQIFLEAALRAKDSPLQLCAWRIQQRQGRPRREQVRDVVEISLEHEKDVIAETQKKLSQAIKATKTQIVALEEKLNELRREIGEKTQALGIDEVCLRTTQKSFKEQLQKTPPRTAAGTPRAASIPAAQTPRAQSTARIQLTTHRSPQVHHQLRESSHNEVYRVRAATSLAHAAALMEESAKDLCAENAKLVARCEKMVQEATTKSEKSMREWISQNRAMNKRLESVIQETVGKIDHTKHAIRETKSQIKALEAPIELTSNCNSWRQQRAFKEHIVDPVTSKLQEHQVTLMKSQEELHTHLTSSKSILYELQERRERLKEDLRDKAVALEIDLTCLSHETLKTSSERIRSSSRKPAEQLMAATYPPRSPGQLAALSTAPAAPGRFMPPLTAR